MSKDRPNFRIIENYDEFADVDYEEFKKDYLNPYILVEDIRKKYDLNSRRYGKLRRRVCEEEGIDRRCSVYISPLNNKRIRKKFKKKVPEFIQKKENGYIVVKRTNYKTKYYGRYKDYKTAKMVRDTLVKHNWDDRIAEHLKQRYALKQDSARKWAEEFYPKWEDLYFNSRLTIKAINEKYKIGTRKYTYLLEILHNKYGKIHRSNFVKCL